MSEDRYNCYGIDTKCKKFGKKLFKKGYWCKKFNEQFMVIQCVALPNCSSLKCNEKDNQK